MNYFPRAHIWLIAPFIIAIGGFSFSYWLKFSEVPFRYHVHGLSATLWYIILIIQPYIYHKKNIQLHRTIGKFSLVVAGAVFASALLMLPHLFSLGLPLSVVRTIIFQDSWTNIGFLVSVCLAIKHSSDIAKHARWMIVSAFWPLGQALFRLLRNILSNWNIEINYPLWSQAIIIIIISALLIDDYRKEKKIYNSYGFALISFILVFSIAGYMAEAAWWKSIIEALFKNEIT
jgi:hypothetical protein